MNLYEKIKDLLDSNNIDYTEIGHEPVFTSEQAAKVRKSNIDEGAKALIFLADDKPIQLVIQGSKRVDKDKFKSQFGFTKLKMASAEQVKVTSGVEPGAVAPFGNLFDPPIPVYATNSLLNLENIEFNAGDHCISIFMKAKDFANLVRPITADYEE